MYLMSKKSLAIRIALLPVYVVLWFFGGIALTAYYLTEKLWNFLDKLTDKFESWVHRIAPLDSDKDKKV